MNRRKAVGSMVLGAAAAASVRVASAAEPEIDIFVEQWRRSKVFTLKVAEAMPADGYTHKPFNGARSFGAEMQHIAESEAFYLDLFGNGKGPKPPAGDLSKAATMKYLTAMFDYSIGVVGKLTRADLTKTYPTPGGPAMSGLAILCQTLIHTAHTRGYDEMYLRTKGIKPPDYAA